MIVGYARVSTDGQTLDAQQSALAAAGAERVFAEKVSDAVTDRKALGASYRGAGRGGRVAGHAAGSARPQHQGPSERAGRGGESRCGISVVGGRVGGYDHTARPIDAHGAGRSGRVRTGANPRPHGRGTRQGASQGRPFWPEAHAHPAPACGSSGPSRSGRSLHGDCAELRCQPQHNQSACGGVVTSELADGVSPTPANSNPIRQHQPWRDQVGRGFASLPHPTRQCGLVMLR